MSMTAQILADKIGAKVVGNPAVSIDGPATLESAEKHHYSFLHNSAYRSLLTSTKASVVITSDSLSDVSEDITYLICEDPYSAFAQSLHWFSEDISTLFSEDSVLDSPFEGVKIGKNVSIQTNVNIGKGTVIFPNVFIGKNVSIGENCLLYPDVVVMHDVVIGNRCVLHPGAIIGADGFGFAPNAHGEYLSIPQSGNVVLEDDVSVGANTCIDRATLGSTVIQKGVKLDNLIQIGHNVVVEAHTVIAAQTGISGSTRIGHHSAIGGQAGFAGHLKIAPYTKVNAQSGVAKSVSEPKTTITGSPAQPFMQHYRSMAHLSRIPVLEEELKALKAQIEAFIYQNKEQL